MRGLVRAGIRRILSMTARRGRSRGLARPPATQTPSARSTPTSSCSRLEGRRLRAAGRRDGRAPRTSSSRESSQRAGPHAPSSGGRPCSCVTGRRCCSTCAATPTRCDELDRCSPRRTMPWPVPDATLDEARALLDQEPRALPSQARARRLSGLARADPGAAAPGLAARRPGEPRDLRHAAARAPRLLPTSRKRLTTQELAQIAVAVAPLLRSRRDSGVAPKGSPHRRRRDDPLRRSGNDPALRAGRRAAKIRIESEGPRLRSDHDRAAIAARCRTQPPTARSSRPEETAQLTRSSGSASSASSATCGPVTSRRASCAWRDLRGLPARAGRTGRCRTSS